MGGVNITLCGSKGKELILDYLGGPCVCTLTNREKYKEKEEIKQQREALD